MRDYGIFWIRVVFGLGFIMHGWPKVADGTEEFAGMLQNFDVPIPAIAAWVVAITEVVGGLFLVLGLMTRIVSVPLIINMIVAIVLVHIDDPTPEDTWISIGLERALFYLTAAAATLFMGAGTISIDNMLFKGDYSE